jgi:hypothetical protein
MLEREAESLGALKGDLIEGYEVAFEALDDLRVEPLPDGLPHYTLMSHLLLRHGDELREWLRNK